GLDASSLVLPPVLVGGVVDGTAILENSSNGVVDVRQISFVGDDAAEFRASATKPWPTLPAAVLPGGKLALGVELAPTGLAGARRTVLEVITTTEDTIRVAVRGEAGIAELEVGPTVLFEDVNIPIGQYVRRTVTITNNGTFPVRLQTPFISGVDAANYTIGALPRRDIDAGQSEFLEVTFRPEQEGTSSATLEIPSSLGTRTVQLGGGSLVTIDRETTPDDGVSGFDVATTGGLRVDAIRPNPTAGAAEVTVWTARAADVVVTVHDGLGRLVAEMARGRYDAGRHTIRFDTGTLAGGVYHVRVSADGASRSMTLTVVR
ncbi:MAG TPA: choice-of-anchor D domain-containing protein, partial [Candidatus Kapabacteria bacterium]|nr:choice-of-anchor D domain-containing protein [Candidatus Kapabacteria bacterium]